MSVSEYRLGTKLEDRSSPKIFRLNSKDYFFRVGLFEMFSVIPVSDKNRVDTFTPPVLITLFE